MHDNQKWHISFCVLWTCLYIFTCPCNYLYIHLFKQHVCFVERQNGYWGSSSTEEHFSMPHFRGWRHFYCHFPLVLQGNSSLPSISAAVQCVAVWIVCYYPAGDNIITTYLLSRVCKEWYHRGPWWSNKLTRCCWITHSYRQEVKH